MALVLGDLVYNLRVRTAQMDRAAGRVVRFGSTLNTAGRKTEGFVKGLRNMESAAVLAVGPLSGVGARIRSLGAVVDRSTLKLAAMVGGITLAAVAIAKLSKAAVNATRDLESLEARLALFSDSTEDANRQFKLVIAVANKAGLPLKEVADGFSRLIAAAQGTALEGRLIEDVFRKITITAGNLRLSGDDLTGILKALEQMLSKGKVTAEELRQQLGDRLFGAFKIAAGGIHLTTQELDKMLKKGQILSEGFLPRFANQIVKTFGIDITKKVQGINASINNLTTSFTLFSKAVDVVFGVSQTLGKALDALTSVFDNMRMNAANLTRGLGAVAGGLIGLFAPAIVKGVFFLVLLLKQLTAAIFAVNIALVSGAGLKFLGFLARLALAAAGAIIGFKLLGKAIGDIKPSPAFEKIITDIESLLKKTGNTKIPDVFAPITPTKAQIASIKKATDLFRDLVDETEALSRGSVAFSKFLRLEGPLEELRKYIKALEKSGMALDKVNEKARLFAIILAARAEFDASIAAVNEFRDIFVSAFDAMAESVADSVIEGKNALEDLADVGKAVAKDLLATFIKLALLNPLKNALFGPIGGSFAPSFSGQAGGGGGGIGSSLINVLSGARDKGGPVKAGKTFLVGESGPELFTPTSSGSITPNSGGGSGMGAPNITVNINTVIDASGAFPESISQIQQQMAERDKALPAQIRAGIHSTFNNDGRFI